MKIIIEQVPNADIKKRKGFGGADWWYDANQNLQIRVATELKWGEGMALAVHELVEALICSYMGISVEEVDEFDSLHIDEEKDPNFNSGDQSNAPYKEPHTYATAVERILTGIFGVDWKSYDENLSKL